LSSCNIHIVAMSPVRTIVVLSTNTSAGPCSPMLTHSAIAGTLVAAANAAVTPHAHRFMQFLAL